MQVLNGLQLQKKYMGVEFQTPAVEKSSLPGCTERVFNGYTDRP